jgi:ABC-2 type transport system permease protein
MTGGHTETPTTSVDVWSGGGPDDKAVSFWASAWIVMWRGWIKTVRMPSIVIQSVFFPTFFLIVYTGLYNSLTDLPGFPTEDITNWFLPFMLFQGAGFGGLGAGFSTAVDIDGGFFDRLLLMPSHRLAIMIGTIGFAMIRSIAVSLIVAVVGVALGASPTDWLGVPFVILCVVAVSVMGSLYSLALIYRLKDQRAVPLFPIGIFILLFVSNAQVPLSLVSGWLNAVGRVNPLSNMLRLSRQAFLDTGVTWNDTWGGLVAIVVCVGLLAWWAERGLRNFNP